MATVQQNTGTLYNALTSGSKIIGTIVTDSDIRVDGVIEGDVQLESRGLSKALSYVRMPRLWVHWMER